MGALHLIGALLSLTAFAASLGEKGASTWGRCAAAVMAVAMVGGVIPALLPVPDVVWCAAMIALAIAAALAQRLAGRQGLDALRMPLGAVLMAALVAATSAGHASTSQGVHEHGGGASVAVIVVLAAAGQLALCLGEMRAPSSSRTAAPRRPRGLLLRAGSMGGAALAMAAAVLVG